MLGPMDAVVIEDGELHYRTRPDPEPGDTELLVEVRAAGLNAADLLQRRGLYPAPPGVPADIPGLELAGEVLSVGPQVTRFAPGDRVMAIVGGGGQATMATVDQTHAVAVPPGIPWDQAGGFPEAFFTAHDALVTQCGLQVGDRVLVTGAAGGVGTAAVQLAAAAGAHVVASVRDPSRHGPVAALGAAEVITPEDTVAHGPYDVVVELVGAISLPVVLTSLAQGGRVAVIGVGSGARVELDLRQLMARRAAVRGSTLRSRSLEDKAQVAGAVARHVVPLLATGRIRVPVTATFPMGDAPDAYRHFAEEAKVGKVVLVR